MAEPGKWYKGPVSAFTFQGPLSATLYFFQYLLQWDGMPLLLKNGLLWHRSEAFLRRLHLIDKSN
jgi:hypothetical protein